MAKAAAAATSSTNVVGEYLQMWTGLAILYGADFFSKKAFLEAGLKFPSSLVGMFLITTVLIAMGEGKGRSLLQAAL